MTARSYLYVPGDRPDRFDKACASGADAVIFDLEDAVALDRRATALDNVLGLLARGDADVERWVRVNPGEAGAREIDALAEQGLATGLVLSKATHRSTRLAATRLGAGGGADGDRLRLCALVETATAVLELASIAEMPGLMAIAVGEVDLAADLAIDATVADQVLAPLRTDIVITSAASGIEGPIGPVWTAIGDHEGHRRHVQRLYASGFAAAQAIHPSQVETINEAMTPTTAAYAAAARLLEQARSTEHGAFVDDSGRMVDEAVLRTARRIVDRHQRFRPEASAAHPQTEEPR